MRREPVLRHQEVRRALEDSSPAENGLQVAAYDRNQLVVDDWTGHATPDRVVDGETLFPVFSVSKAVCAVAVHIQVGKGLLSLDQPIADVWPEFGSHGKERASVTDALAHRLGIPQMPEGIDESNVGNWDLVVEKISQLEPIYEPGTKSTYLAMTYGWILGELVRRTDPSARYFNQFIQEELCRPLGISDIWFGLPASCDDRLATLSDDGGFTAPEPGSLRDRALPRHLALCPEIFNRTTVRRACLPAVGGIMNARSGARFWAMLANGGELDGTRILPEALVRRFVTPRPEETSVDAVFGDRMVLGEYGFWLGSGPTLQKPLGGGDHILAHPGVGGSIGWADTQSGSAGMICKNKMTVAGYGSDAMISIAQALRSVVAGH